MKELIKKHSWKSVQIKWGGQEAKGTENWDFALVKADNESGKKVKVVRVLKPTAWRSDNGGGYFVPYEKGGTSWRDNEKLRSDLESKYSRNIYSTGKLGELVVETCDHQWGWLEWGKQDFCRTILEKFFGADVKNKRYCLYEMPEAEKDFTSAAFFKKRKND